MTTETKPAIAGQWKERFRAPRVLWTERADGNPERGLACTNRSGVYQLYAWDVPTGTLTQITHRREGVLVGTLSPDGESVYYFEDTGGNEVGEHVRVPWKGGPAEVVAPDLRDYSSWAMEHSRDGSTVGFTAGNESGFHVYVMNVGDDGVPGSPREILSSPTLTAGPWLSYSGDVAVVMMTERGNGPEFSLVGVDTSTGQRLHELWDGEGTSIRAIGFSPVPGDFRLLAAGNASGSERPLIWNPLTGERQDILLPDLDGEVAPADWSPDGRRLLLAQTAGAVQHLYTYDLGTGALTPLHHPAGVQMAFNPPYFTPEGEIFVHWQDAAHPPCLIALDGETGRQTRVVLQAGEVPPGRPFRSVSFTGANGDSIQGWLGVPEGTGPFPTVLHTHGGPEGVMTDLYSPEAQLWLDHGFAFLTINYHGSTTFGREFQRSIWGHPGDLEVQDMVAAREWLVREGIARPDAVLLTGWSYGGYLTLLGLGQEPSLWAGGMAGIAIADWSVQYEDCMEIIKAYQAAIFGGTPEERPEQYAVSSPITYVEQVQAPVLVIQGRNDARCPPRPMEMYEARMRELGKPIEVHWFESGHAGAFMDVEQSVRDHETMLAFAQRVIGVTPPE